MMFYYEQYNSLGHWTPRTASERPNMKLTEGTKPKIRHVRELTAKQSELSLKALERLFNPVAPEHDFYSVLIDWGDDEGDYSWAGWADSVEDAEAKARDDMWEQTGKCEGEDPPLYGAMTTWVRGYNMWAAGTVYAKLLELGGHKEIMDILRPPEVL